MPELDSPSDEVRAQLEALKALMGNLLVLDALSCGEDSARWALDTVKRRADVRIGESTMPAFATRAQEIVDEEIRRAKFMLDRLVEAGEVGQRPTSE